MTSAHASLGAYAVDAIDGSEALDVEHHLTECEACRREFDEFGETAAELTRLVAMAPPAAVRRSVLHSIGQIRPLPPEVPQETRADVVPITARRRPAVPWLAGLVAASVLAVGACGWALHTRQQLEASQQARVEAGRQTALNRTESTILQAPDAAVYPARLQNGSSVSYLVAKSQNAAMVLTGDFPDPGPGRTYQLWTLTPGRQGGVSFVPDHTFAGGRDQRVVVTGDLHQAVGLAITVEPTGGSLQPTTDPDARATF